MPELRELVRALYHEMVSPDPRRTEPPELTLCRPWFTICFVVSAPRTCNTRTVNLTNREAPDTSGDTQIQGSRLSNLSLHARSQVKFPTPKRKSQRPDKRHSNRPDVQSQGRGLGGPPPQQGMMGGPPGARPGGGGGPPAPYK